MALTAKQAQFVQEYLVDLNGTQAAIRAGYSERTANEQAARLMKNPDVAAAISAAKGERSAETKITAEWVLRRLADEADADLADLYDEQGALLPVNKWPLIWRRGLVQGVEVEELNEGGLVVGRVRKLRLDNRVRRLELIGKHIDVSAFAENVKHQISGSLADRLQRAIDAANDEPRHVRAAPPLVIDAVPAEPTALAEPPPSAGPDPKPEPVKPVDPLPGASDEIIGATPPAYQPLWPASPATVDVEYDPISAWNLG